ncbi:putative hemolysin [Segnochrobactrum spirostomi]|uniref:DUF333 domain-containing protein n=1 Tax=Segnochrobactrum spirostomi TaxID=2608987 RepID=A0A6A7XYR1_9HYPH|nr:DUF333 domain-containing protein [Segnochrobactrum spirostomi]MQT11458.1 DUF333 domain-containing protein [Segnochrobactrum spirostomi]
MKKSTVIAICVGTMIPSAAWAMANPASVFCGKMGGHTVNAKLADGSEISLCYLPGNKIVEEWTLFRMFDGKKPAPGRNPFK